MDNKTTINLEPGDSVTIVTDNPVDGNCAIFKEYIVIFNNTEFFSCFAGQRRSPYGGWNPEIPLYPISYKIHSDENERNHTIYEFTFTNSHYENVGSESWAHEEICTTEKGERYFKGWEYYDGPQSQGMGVTIDNLVWSPCNYNSTMRIRGYHSYYKYEEALTICPKGWRIPTAVEFTSLMSNHSQWGETRGESVSDPKKAMEEGYWFSGSNKYTLEAPAVFFPSHYLWSDNDLKVGMYWTATKDSDGLAQAFRFR